MSRKIIHRPFPTNFKSGNYIYHFKEQLLGVKRMVNATYIPVWHSNRLFFVVSPSGNYTYRFLKTVFKVEISCRVT